MIDPQAPTGAGHSWAFVELLGAAALRTLGDLQRSLGGERRSEEAARQGHEERAPVHERIILQLAASSRRDGAGRPSRPYTRGPGWGTTIFGFQFRG